jgi:hypothetical protein
MPGRPRRWSRPRRPPQRRRFASKRAPAAYRVAVRAHHRSPPAARPLFPICVAFRNPVWNESRDHRRLYIRSAAASARLHPARFPCASSRRARAKVAANAACAFCSARLTEAGVGWTSSCAPIDCGAIGPAFGFPADWRTACSNCAILLLHGPACAAATPRPRAAATSKVAEIRWMARRRISMTCARHRRDKFRLQEPPTPRTSERHCL